MKTKEFRLDELVDRLVPGFKPVVESIEGRWQFTKNHYGDYLELLSKFNESQGSQIAKIVAIALIRAGANKYGVRSALEIMGLVEPSMFE
jgi:hypothetical protein